MPILTSPIYVKRIVGNSRNQGMMLYFNLLFFSTLLLTLALFGLGFRFALKSTRPRALLFGAVAGLMTAIPALLFVVAYNGHLFDLAIWIYEFLALPNIELSVAGLGWTAGFVMGRLQRRAFRNQSKVFWGILWGVALFCFLLILFVLVIVFTGSVSSAQDCGG